MYGKIISFLFVLLILYYVAMIFLDLQKLKAAKAADKEKNREEEIDISDEASTFKPVLITRDEPSKGPETEKTEANNNETQPGGKTANPETTEPEKAQNPETPVPEEKQASDEKIQDVQEQTTSDESPDIYPGNAEPTPDTESPELKIQEDKPYRRPGYRQSTMTDGVVVETIIEYVDLLAETGTGPLGGVIYSCHNA